MQVLISKVEGIEFESIKWKMLNSDNCRLSEEEVDVAIHEYKRFLELRIKYPSISFAPTSLMDEVWHFHIIDTRKYRKDCEILFGKFLHHSPSYGPYDSKEKKDSLLQSSMNLKKLYVGEFNQSPIGLSLSCSGCSGDGSACTGVSCCSGCE